MTRVFFDCEFMEDGTTIEPLSLAFVAETGQRLYVVIADADHSKASAWVEENVLPHLRWLDAQDATAEWDVERDVYLYIDRAQAGQAIHTWLIEIGAVVNPRLQPEPQVEFWADYADYDWIVLCQLYGRMLDLPKGFPMFAMDIQQFKRHVGFTGKLPEVEGTAHCAMDDALNVQQRHRLLVDFVPTATWPHPCASQSEPAARRIMRDIEDGHLNIRRDAQGHHADREYSKAGLSYALFWGWLEVDGLGRLHPTEGWSRVRG